MRRPWLGLLVLSVAGCIPAASPVMEPGNDCLACHAEGQSKLPWTLSGTIYAAPDARAEQGIAGVEVQATGSDGKVLTLESNSAGNFYTRETVAFPVQLRLRRGDQVKEMTRTLDGVTGCASCHAATPVEGAPGRLYLPPPPPLGGALCRSCRQDADCGGEGSCITEPLGTHVCATRCQVSKEGSCQPGYSCAKLVDADGKDRGAGCVPQGGAACPAVTGLQ